MIKTVGYIVFVLSIMCLHLCSIVRNLLADKIFAIYHASHDSHKKRGGFSSYRSCSAINNLTLSKFDRNSCREKCIVKFERGKISISIPLFLEVKDEFTKKFHFFSNVERKKKCVKHRWNVHCLVFLSCWIMNLECRAFILLADIPFSTQATHKGCIDLCFIWNT